MRVEVKNFMTYANCVIEPGPKLNLVLGPNGECHRPLPLGPALVSRSATARAPHLDRALTPPPARSLPAGTGKSSLVCAIGVGLAGGTNLLGRAQELSEFVRRGTDVGEVTITLASGDPTRPHVVRRRIYAANNNSEWWLDGESPPPMRAV